jgi:hypothetical protein
MVPVLSDKIALNINLVSVKYDFIGCISVNERHADTSVPSVYSLISLIVFFYQLYIKLNKIYLCHIKYIELS